MLVILEGADKQGKTTLARNLANKLQWRYVHHGRPIGGKSGYLRELLQLQDNTVMDRSFIGEMVYGPLLRGNSCINLNETITLLRLAGRHGVTVIHCHGAATPRRLDGNDKAYGITPEVNKMAAGNFKLLMSVVDRFVDVVDYTMQPLIKNQDTWIKLFVHQYVNLKVLPCFKYLQDNPTGYGEMIAPTGFLVGDSLNLKASWAELPFDAGSSSEYLNQILLKYGPRSLRHYLINARTNNQWSDITELHQVRSKNLDAKIIALGNIAANWLAAYSVPHIVVPHPSYWKRFKSKEPARYGQLIREALQWKALIPVTR